MNDMLFRNGIHYGPERGMNDNLCLESNKRQKIAFVERHFQTNPSKRALGFIYCSPYSLGCNKMMVESGNVIYACFDPIFRVGSHLTFNVDAF